ncbi:MAG: hypothetical protein ACKOI0_00335 [Actinomycetota bacterium]
MKAPAGESSVGPFGTPKSPVISNTYDMRGGCPTIFEMTGAPSASRDVRMMKVKPMKATRSDRNRRQTISFGERPMTARETSAV